MAIILNKSTRYAWAARSAAYDMVAYMQELPAEEFKQLILIIRNNFSYEVQLSNGVTICQRTVQGGYHLLIER